MIDLDREILSINNSVHWKLNNIPRVNGLWFHVMTESMIEFQPTVYSHICLEEHLASPTMALPQENWAIEDTYRIVSPKTQLTEARTAFLTCVCAEAILQQKDVILALGLDFTPDSFPFRELTSALISIASNQTKFHSFPPQSCDPRNCLNWPPGMCNSDHLPKSLGWLSEQWSGQSAPLLEFGSSCHLPGEPPGASPRETIYWHEQVLISLVSVTDAEATVRAAKWGIAQGKNHFQIIVISLLKVILAEASFENGSELSIPMSRSIDLSPLRAEYCTSTHPYNRPTRDYRVDMLQSTNELITKQHCTGSIEELQTHFPGLAAMVNFFDVALNRQAASRSVGALPPEVYQMVVDSVDYETWQSCAKSSIVLRACSLRNHRLNDRMAIVAGPYERRQNAHRPSTLSFDFKNLEKGSVTPMAQVLPIRRKEEHDGSFMPIVGDGRKALMVNVIAEFKPLEDEDL